MMADHESDGIGEAFEGSLRIAIMAAGRVGEEIARQRERELREAEAASRQRAAEYAARIAAEKEAARAAIAPVYRPEWWDAARPADIIRAYQAAKSLGGADPEGVRADVRIVEELHTRFGVDVRLEAVTDEAGLRARMDRAEQARSSSPSEPGVEGSTALLEAVAAEQAAEAHDDELGNDGPAAGAAPSSVRYDSPERRALMAAALGRKADVATVEARVRADTAQGAPATEATRKTSSRSPKARKRGRGPGKQVERDR